MADAVKKTVEGWLIKYDRPSAPLQLPNGRKLVEVIQQDAFRSSIDAINAGLATIECNIEHADDALCRIGLSGKNVKVENRPEGVYATIQLIADSLSADIFTRIQAGLINGLSVEFTPAPGIEAGYDIGQDGSYVRSWTQLNLTGFAICAEPAYPDATIVKATDGATFTRSIKTAELAKIAAEIEQIERTAAEGQRKIYEYEKFLLGIR